MDWLLAPDSAPRPLVDAALLVLRLVVGSAFVLHGRPKLAQPTRWMNAMGSRPPPGVLQALAVLAEVGGGLSVALGLFTRLGALGIAATMIGALVTVHLPQQHPYVAVGRPSSELPLVYLAIALLLLAVGPGAWSLDAVLFR